MLPEGLHFFGRHIFMIDSRKGRAHGRLDAIARASSVNRFVIAEEFGKEFLEEGAPERTVLAD